MRIICGGCFEYVLNPRFRVQSEIVEQTKSTGEHRRLADGIEVVSRGQVISEAALWTLWEHCGWLTAKEAGFSLILESDKFKRITFQYHTARWMAILYARRFTAQLDD